MITIVSQIELDYLNRLRLADPFQLAVPCYMSFSSLLLPLERVITCTYIPSIPNQRRVTNMPLKVLTTIPARTTVRGIPIPEFAEILEALKKLPAKQALDVTLSAPTVERFTKTNKKGTKLNPVKLFALSLMRKFNTDALPYVAYVSESGNSVIVCHEK